MLSETLTTALEGYAIGPKIRRLRLRKKLGLVQLGEHTGLSPALLSKIERGHLFPTLPTLLRIALVFGVGLDHFFKEDSDRPVHAVVRKADRIRLPDKAGRTSPAYHFESLDYPVSDRKLNGYYVEIEAEERAVGAARASRRGNHLRSARRAGGEPRGRGFHARRGRLDVFRFRSSAQLPPPRTGALRGHCGRDRVIG